MNLVNFKRWVAESIDDRGEDWLNDLGLISGLESVKLKILNKIRERPELGVLPKNLRHYLSEPFSTDGVGGAESTSLWRATGRAIAWVKSRIKADHRLEFAENIGIPITRGYLITTTWDRVKASITNSKIGPRGELLFQLEFSKKTNIPGSYAKEDTEKEWEYATKLANEINEVTEGVWYSFDDWANESEESLTSLYETLLNLLPQLHAKK